jgi:hypothetical protein
MTSDVTVLCDHGRHGRPCAKMAGGNGRTERKNHMNRIVRDNRQQPIAHIRDAGNTVQIFDRTGGKLLGYYAKAGNATYDASGRLIGHGDQLLRLVR